MYVKTCERVFMWQISNVWYHEVFGYYDKEVQFVILLNMWHLDNMTIFSFPKCEVGL